MAVEPGLAARAEHPHLWGCTPACGGAPPPIYGPAACSSRALASLFQPFSYPQLLAKKEICTQAHIVGRFGTWLAIIQEQGKRDPAEGPPTEASSGPPADHDRSATAQNGLTLPTGNR